MLIDSIWWSAIDIFDASVTQMFDIKHCSKMQLIIEQKFRKLAEKV